LRDVEIDEASAAKGQLVGTVLGMNVPTSPLAGLPKPDDEVNAFFESLSQETVDYEEVSEEVTSSVQAIFDYLGPLQQWPSDL
jgi:hypothetical protein